jgi:cytochrome P450
MDYNQMAVNSIIETKRRQKSSESFLGNEGSIKSDSLFSQLVNSGMPESELSVERLASEAQVILGAGTITTARSMDHLVVYILRNRRIHKRLREELKEVMADFPETVPSWQTLEKLPYLYACIKEGLR